MRPLADGERVHLIDRKEREYPLTLRADKIFQFSGQTILHNAIIGLEEGSIVTLSRGATFQVFRPTLAQYVLKMPRGAQIIYPKDLATIAVWADIYPGATVVEAGTGSGALTMLLLRAVGPSGRVISYETREDFAKRGLENIECYLGKTPNLEARAKDIYEGIEEDGIDRLVLDVPEPWRVVASAAEKLRGGGIYLCYLPTILQTMTVVETLRREARFTGIDVFETMLRTWNVDGMSVRPDHRMVAHTAFITTARKAEPLWRRGDIGREEPPAKEDEKEDEDEDEGEEDK